MSQRQPRFRPPFATHGNQGDYGGLVGKFTDLITTDFGNPHARLVLDVNGSRYEVDVNVYSTHDAPGYPQGSDVQFAIRDEAVASLPASGPTEDAGLSYVSLGLHQADFTTVDEDVLHDKIDALARASDLIEVYGVIYRDPDGTQGIHDVHMNSGESGTAATATSKDGAIAFYSNPQIGGQANAHAQWVFIKFATQALP